MNVYVIVLEEGLAARGEASQDTMMNLHAAYIICKDADFVQHAKDEYACWDQGTNMTLKEYMASACTKYQTLIMKGLWESPSPEQEQIIALTAAVSSLKSRTGKAPGGRAVTGKQRDQVTPRRSGPRKKERDYAWKDIAPKAGDPNKKQVKGKDYFWCTRYK
jgi:hypothetical protein